MASFPVVNAGLTAFYNSRRLVQTVSAFLGFAVSNMNVPNESFVRNSTSRLPMLMKVHGGAEHALTKYWDISYHFLWMYQNHLAQLNTGAYLSHKSHSRTDPFILTMGAWYRWKDSFIVLAGISKSQLNIGFSYDLNTAALRYTTGGQGAYEISLMYRIPKIKNLKRFSTPLL